MDLSENLKKLNSLNRERIFWLRISGFVVFSFFLVVFNWNKIVNSDLLWTIVGAGVFICILWWYWTMSIIRKLISFKTLETEIMSELLTDIKAVRTDIRNSFKQPS